MGKQDSNCAQRFNAYKDVLKSAGIDARPEWIIRDDPEKRCSGPALSAGGWLARRMMKEAPDVTAAMASDDGLAVPALNEFHRMGVRIPDDISITGFDNNPESLSCWPPLTTVAHPIEEAAAMAADSIVQAIESPGKWTPPATVLPTRLIIRESTGSLKRK